MKRDAASLLLLLLAGCDRSVGNENERAPVATPSAEAPQASIMRPEVAKATSNPPPLEPLEVTVSFPEGGAALSAGEVARLARLVASPQVKLGGPIRLGAHSDSAGGDAANLAASRARGEAVRAWLIEHGVAAERITLVAFGEQNPAEPNARPDGSPNLPGRAANRRVTIQVPVAGSNRGEQREPTLAEEIVERTQDGVGAPAPSENID